MHGKNYVVSVDELVEFFQGSASQSKKAIPNLFAKVPHFKTERDMYDHFVSTTPNTPVVSLTPNHRQTRTFNQSGIFRGHQFVTTAWKSDPNDTTKQAIDCGMYPSQYVPSEDQTAAGDESRRTDWSRIDLCIECKLHSTRQDPFDERNEKNEPEAEERRQVLGQILSYAQLVSKHQQRTFHYMLLFFRECALRV